MGEAGKLELKLIDGSVRETVAGGSVASVLGSTCNGLPVVASLFNNDIVSLNCRILTGGTLYPLTAADEHGWRVLNHSMCLLLAMAVRRLYPKAAFRIKHSIGHALFCTLDPNPDCSGNGPDQKTLAAIETEMHKLVDAKLPVIEFPVCYNDAIKLFADNGQTDKLNLLRHINEPMVRLVSCDGFLDLFQGTSVPDTGCLGLFKLIQADGGFIMNMPDRKNPSVLAEYKPQAHLLKIYREHSGWGRILGIQTVGQLNEAIFNQRIHEVIQMSEAFHDRKLVRIADQISSRPEVKLVLIAGPSSAGKTTSAKRLATHLQVNGLRPLVLETDDYFVGEDKNPVGPDGKPDYEHIEAMDLPALNRDLRVLLSGGTIKRRIYDFKTKRPVMTDEDLTLGSGGILIMEGLHGLNPRLTSEIARENKFHIYLSALTQLGLDDNNRISTTDNRLIRRIVRDSRFRGHSALRTMRLWPGVRRGEERWIFPFQGNADATFNSSLDYELAVLKPFAESLLTEIKPHMPEYPDARRLQSFLSNFHAITADAVPGDSILREYIGNSQLRY